MAHYKVILEIEIDSDSSLNAAKKVQEWIQDPFCNWQYYVQESKNNTIFSVDLEDNDDNAVMEIPYYTPLISNPKP